MSDRGCYTRTRSLAQEQKEYGTNYSADVYEGR
jgi:hypothetical protein